MIGAYVTFVVQQTIRTSFPGLFDYSLLIAVPLAFIVAGAIGIVIERTIIRFLYGRPLETLLATWGLSLVLQQAVRTMFGPTNQEVGNPSWMSGAFQLGQISITYNRLWILCFTMAVFVILLAMLRYTALGLEMRAVTQNRRMAASMGIATSRVDALTFGLGSGIAGIAGVALSQIDNVSPNLGQSYIIDSFMVVVFGGVGNLWGTLGRRLHARHRQQVPGAGGRRGARQDRHPGLDHPVHPETAARPVRAQRPGGGSMMPHILTRSLDRSATVFLLVVAAARRADPAVEPAVAGRLVFPGADLSGGAVRQICLLRHPGALDRPDLGLLRHSLARPWRVLRARRLRDGHVSDAPDRQPRRLRQSAAAGLHGVPELHQAALVLARLRYVLVRGGDGAAGAWPAGVLLRLAGVSLARHRRLSVDHHPGDDLCAAAGLLPQRFRLRRQ